jgi:hypothetical protein
MRRVVSAAAVIVGATLASALLLKRASVPFFWMGLVWGVAGFAVAAWAPRWLRFPLVMLGTLPLVLALGEAFFAVTAPLKADITTVPLQNQDDPLLGWKPKPSQVTRATARAGGTVIYEATYTTDAAGHRITPPVRGDRVDGCVLFFADSFTFGEGVNDAETFPYQVGVKTQGRFRVVNMAVGAYGAEHMLASIERGELAGSPPCEPTHIIYAALPHHVLRAAGKTAFSVFGPRYRLGPDGGPQYVGTTPRAAVGASRRGWRAQVAEQLAKSRIRGVVAERMQATEGDVELYFAIVREAFRRFASRWPKAERHVISWDIHPFYSNGVARFHEGLKTVDATVHSIDDILPGYTKDPGKYALDRADMHPNARAHEMVATYLANHLLLPELAAVGRP